MNDKAELLQEWKKLASEIRKHNKLYERGRPLIGDNYYDLLTQRLAWIEEQIGPQKNSPLHEVRSNNMVAKVPHLQPMLSLDHGFLAESISAFLKRLRNLTPDCFPMVAEHKLDGVALALRYVDGKLALALTRGNGTLGVDVTQQIKHLPVPRELDFPGTIEVRGELFMKFADFEPIKDRFSSPRNACAAFIQNKLPISYMKINFFPHNVIGVEAESYLELMESLSSFGSFVRKKCLNEEDCLDFFHSTETGRDQLEYPIDGVVFKLDSLSDWQKIGFHRTAPRYAFAAKFTPLFKKTTIREIEMQVGKFGTITPVAIFDQIEIDGSNIRRASLHNMEELQKRGYGPGDEVLVSRAGDTIPYISEKLYDAGNPVWITQCPSCGRDLLPFEQTLRCPGAWDCREQKICRLEHFCSRNAFNIQGLGGKIIDSFIKHGFIDYPCDIFRLSERRNQILELEGWSQKSVANLIAAVEQVREVKLENLIFGLCIPNVGYGNAVSLAKYFGSFDAFVDYFKNIDNSEEIISDSSKIQEKIKKTATNENKTIFGIGKSTTQSIYSFLNSQDQQWLSKLIIELKIS